MGSSSGGAIGPHKGEWGGGGFINIPTICHLPRVNCVEIISLCLTVLELSHFVTFT